MLVFGNLIGAIAFILDKTIDIYIIIVIVAALITWVSPDPYNPIIRFLRSATEPLLYRIRRYLPALGGIDFSPLILVFALIFLQMFVVQTLMDIAYRLR